MSDRLPPGATESGDHELMARLASGDDLALNELMRRWSDRIVSFLYRMTGRHETAVDLAQETFVKLYQARDRYRPRGGEFSTWLFAIASNLAKNHARWRSRHPEVSLDATAHDGSPSLPEPRSTAASPDQSAVTRETEKQVQVAILALPGELREALLLFTHEQLGYADIARITHGS
ncbi:sigma-70 family RNA polymerase sigma factor, partial [bacterium]|nr:sigma-70 family RNA polymerase sigma factor [bacterium]